MPTKCHGCGTSPADVPQWVWVGEGMFSEYRLIYWCDDCATAVIDAYLNRNKE